MKKIDLDELYWADWEGISQNKQDLNIIFEYINNHTSMSLEELGKTLKLYNNPSGLFTDEFANIVGEIYLKDKIRFIKALTLVKDEAINLVYIFRMKNIFVDEDKEFTSILNSNKLSQEELDTANTFIKMYKTICST